MKKPIVDKKALLLVACMIVVLVGIGGTSAWWKSNDSKPPRKWKIPFAERIVRWIKGDQTPAPAAAPQPVAKPTLKGDPVWNLPLPSLADGEHSYHFVVDGVATADPFNELHPERGIERIFHIPAALGELTPIFSVDFKGFLYKAPISRSISYVSPSLGGAWGAIEFSPGNDAARYAVEALAADSNLRTISGKACASDLNTGLAGARIRVALENGAFERTAVCNDKGEFRIQRLPRTPLLIAAQAPGYAMNQWQKIEAGADGAIDLRLDAGGSIEGYVRDEKGNVLGGALVQISALSANSPDDYQAITDVAGHYVAKSLSIGPHTVSVKAPGYSLAVKPDFAVQKDLAQQAHFILSPGSSLSGRASRMVKNATVGAEGLRIEARLQDSSILTQETWSKADGSFELLDLPHGVWLNIVCSDTRAGEGAPARRILINKNEKPAPMEFSLGQGGVITGRVLGEFGKPLAEAEVRWVQTQSSSGNVSPRNPGEKSGSALSDGQGNFTLQGLAAKNLYQLEVRAKSYQTLTTPYLPVSDQMQQVALYRGTTLSGRVVDGAKMRPLGGIELEARAQANQARPSAPIRCITDDAGNFQLNLVPPGLYIITGRSTENPAKWVCRPLEIQVYDNQTLSHLSLTGWPSAAVKGTIFFTGTTQPVKNTAIQIVSHDPEQVIAETLADDQGRFLFADLTPGIYGIRLSAAPSTTETQVTIGAGRREASATIYVSPTGEIRGKLLDSSGAPMVNRYVQAQMLSDSPLAADCREKSAQTDASGNFRITDLPLDRNAVLRYRVISSTFESYCAVSAPVELAIATSASDISPQIIRAGSISGRVLNYSGSPLAGATVTASIRPGNLEWPAAITGEDGSYKFDNLPDGEYTIRARNANGMIKEVSGISLQNGSSRSALSLTIERGRTLQGRVIDKTRTALKEVTCTASSVTTDTASSAAYFPPALTDLTGSFTIEDLPVNQKIQLELRYEKVTGYSRTSICFTTGAFDPPDEQRVIMLPMSGALSGRVLSGGSPLSRAAFILETASPGAEPKRRLGMDLQPTQVYIQREIPQLSNGRFELKDLPAGEYYLTIRSGDRIVQELPSVKIDPSTPTDLGDISGR